MRSKNAFEHMIPAPIVSLTWLFILFATIGNASDTSRHNLVAIIGTLPSGANTKFVSAFSNAANEKYSELNLQTQSLQTMDSAETTTLIVRRFKNRKPCAIIYLDSSAEKLLGSQVKAPSFILLRTKENAADRILKNDINVIETQPKASEVVRVLASLQPAPIMMGLAYTSGTIGHDGIISGLKKSLASEPELAKMKLMECQLMPGACRNNSDIRQSINKDLSTLQKGSVIVILPDTNTIKFAFEFRNFATKRKIGIIGLADFNSGRNMISVQYTPDQLATQCLDAIAGVLANHPAQTTIPPCQVKVDDALLKECGFSLQK